MPDYLKHGPYSYPMGTGIDPEEYAYGSVNYRRARAYVPLLGKVRSVEIGLPDTWFSIPGRIRINGKWRKGWLAFADQSMSESWAVPEGTAIFYVFREDG